LVPFADRRFRRDEMIESEAPPELAELLEEQIGKGQPQVPSDDFLEIRCVSQAFAAATFMVRRDDSGKLRLLVPAQALRRAN
jgi:hypothetical protein